MLRAGWAHAPSYMLSMDSACIHHTLLLARKAVVCKEEVYRNLQQSFSDFGASGNVNCEEGRIVRLLTEHL